MGLCKEIDLKVGVMHPMSIVLPSTFRFWRWAVFASREETDLAGDCRNVVVVVVDLLHTMSSSSSFLQEEGDECKDADADADADLCLSLVSRAIGMEKQPISALGSRQRVVVMSKCCQ